MKTLLFALLFIAGNTFAQQKSRLVVAKDGSGDFTSIQEAVSSVRDFSYFAVTIFIKKGVYREKLLIPSWKTGITLSGEDKDSTVIVNGDHTGKILLNNNKVNTFTSYTLQVAGNDNIIENLTIENNAPLGAGQAVALHVEGDRCIIRNCKLLGNQDTLYAAGGASRQYYTDCYIEGTTDFIFGAATAIFNNCIINSKTNSFITAASTTRHQEYGYVLINCKLIASEGVNKVYLGRPWRPYAATIFINCELGKHITPEGWNIWDKKETDGTMRYAEYKNTGPGAATNARAGWTRQLTDKEAKSITVTKVFEGWDPLKQQY